jgi:two-component system, chemotaxis family, chemotaxis protein CheY
MGLCILLVDDSATVRSLVKVFLMGHDFAYIEASGAEHALEILRARVPDIVIADINMPGLDGLSFLRRIRLDPRAEVQALPVILLTSEKSPDVRERALDAGANEFVRKPVSSSDLQQAIQRLLPALSPSSSIGSSRGKNEEEDPNR